MVLSLVKGTVFIFLIGLGIAGNYFLLVNYVCIFRHIEKKSTHLILIHLAFTNIIMLLSRGMTRTIVVFGLINFLDDIGCKVVVYLERVARGLSMFTTCLLTVVQAITISPRASRWRKLKPRSAWHVLPLFLYFWILNSLISVNLPLYIRNVSTMNTSQIIKRNSYCYFVPENWILRWVFLTLMILRDALFQGVMGGASGYMVFLLHKHHRHVLYLQNSKLRCKTPPELKAAQSVLLLMLCFLLFYWADCFISLYLSFSLEYDSILVTVQEFLTLGYVILSPFVVILRDGRLAEFWGIGKREGH